LLLVAENYLNGNIAVTGTGSLSGGTVTATAGIGSVSVNQGSLSGTLSGSADGSFVGTISSGSLTVGSVTANNGNLTLVLDATGTTITLVPDAALYANEGSVLVQNNNTSSGSIAVGQGAAITAFTLLKEAVELGNVTITIGPAPETPVA